MNDGSAEQGSCCEHAPACATHQTPFDGGYVECTCAVGTGSIRHEYVHIKQAAQRQATVEDLSRTAFGALLALEAGQRDIAVRLLSDLLVRAERSHSALSADPPEDSST